MRFANLKTTIARFGRAWPIAACIVFPFLAQTPASADQPPLGLTLAVQPWTPITDDDDVHFVFDKQTLLSDQLNTLWQKYSGDLRTLIINQMQMPNLVMRGVTFYDVDVNLTQPTITFDKIDGTVGAGKFTLAVRIDLKNEGATLTSTTPDLIKDDPKAAHIGDLVHIPLPWPIALLPNPHMPGVGKWGDPRCSVNFDATVRLSATIENKPGALLTFDQADPNSTPVVDFTRVDFDSNNFVCDIPVGLLKLLSLKPMVQALVTNAPKDGGIVEGPLNDLARKMIGDAIKTVDAAVAPYQRPELNLIALQGWLVNEGGGQRAVFNLAPTWRWPDPTAGRGRLTGTITAAQPVGLQSQAGTVHCEQLPVTVARKWGPRKMVSPSGTLGNEDYEALSVKPGCSEGQLKPGQTGHYSITGLSALFPQTITFGTAGAGCNGPEAGVKQGIDVRTVGWDDGKMLPQDLYLQGVDLNTIVSAVKTQQPASLFSQHDITARHWLLPCGNVERPFDLSKFLWQINPGDIASNPATNVANPAVNTATPLASGSPLSAATAALAAAQGGAPAISGSLAGNLANAKNLAIQNLAINPAGAASIVPQTQQVMTQNLPLPANCKDTPEGRVCSQSQQIIVGTPVSPSTQQQLGLVGISHPLPAPPANIVGLCSGTLINQYWVLTAHHCVATNGWVNASGPSTSMTTGTIDGQPASLVSLPCNATVAANTIQVTAPWSGQTVTATRVVDFCPSRSLDIALIYLGNGDFGPTPIQLLHGGDIDVGTVLTAYGAGLNTYAQPATPAGPGVPGTPATPMTGSGYRSAVFQAAAVDPGSYGYAPNSGGQIPAAGDSGGPDLVTTPGNGITTGIAGVHSYCSISATIPSPPALPPGTPVSAWTWATAINGCASASIASVRSDIISITQDTPLSAAGTDRPGSDIASSDLATADLCSQACQANTACQAWSYALPGVQGPSGRCWQKNPAPAPVASSCCVSGVKLPPVGEKGVNRPGSDIQKVSLPGNAPELCYEACAANASCRAWTFVSPNQCWLKNPVPAARNDACCISGVKLPALALVGVDRPGFDIAATNLPANDDPNLCAQACDANAACQAWTFSSPNHCWLKKPVPTAKNDPCCISGIKLAAAGPVNPGNNAPPPGPSVPSIPTAPKPAAGVNVTGYWLLRLANGHMNTAYLQQDAVGNVTGQYENGKINSGVVVGNEIFGRWQEGSDGGTVHFILAPDNFTFAGLRTAGDVPPVPKNSASSWDGYRTDKFPAVANDPDFSGTWTVTQSDGRSYAMTLTQNGDAIGGNYDPASRKGIIRGKVGIYGVIIKHAEFEWSQAGNGLRGSGWLNRYPDGSGFSGVWRMPDNTAGAWSAKRLPATATKPSTGGTTLPGKLSGVPLPMAPPPVPPQPDAAGLVALSVTCSGFVRGTKEECGQTADLPFTANGATNWVATLKAPDAHCSSIIYYVSSPTGAIKTDAQYALTHGYPGTRALAAGQSVQVTFTAAFPAGAQHLAIHAIGVPGGCNGGTLSSWGVEASIAATGAPAPAATSKLKFHTKGITGKGTPPIEQPR